MGAGRGHRPDVAPLVQGRVIALDICRHPAVPQSATCSDRDNTTGVKYTKRKRSKKTVFTLNQFFFKTQISIPLLPRTLFPYYRGHYSSITEDTIPVLPRTLFPYYRGHYSSITEDTIPVLPRTLFQYYRGHYSRITEDTYSHKLLMLRHPVNAAYNLRRATGVVNLEGPLVW